MKNTEFGFGLETEHIICEKDTFAPLDHNDLSFESLLNTLQSIEVEDFSTEGLNVKPLHSDASPYLVEGYYLVDEKMKPTTLLAKGIEIRTPLARSIDKSIEDMVELYSRLNSAMQNDGKCCSIISHHPVSKPLSAPPNYERHDYWQWALTAMTTYGPDINISVPDALAADIDIDDLARKLNYYMPAACSLSFASPLTEGKLWTRRNLVGKSIRSYRRSLWAPLFYVHKKPALRFEFKGFEMSNSVSDYEAYFLISLAMLLDDSLKGRASDQTRIYDLGALAVDGLAYDTEMQDRAKAALESAERIGVRLRLNVDSLDALWKRLETKRLPSDDIVDTFLKTGSINEVLRRLSKFERKGQLPASVEVPDTAAIAAFHGATLA